VFQVRWWGFGIEEEGGETTKAQESDHIVQEVQEGPEGQKAGII